MSDLPTEILVEILSRLPVESLVQFKCVCKSWYALFESPQFISNHIVNQPMGHITLMRCNGYNVISLIGNGNDGNDDVSCLVDIDLDLRCPFPCSLFPFPCSLYLHGQYDGILAMSDLHEVMIICNPAIREVRHLPTSSFPQNMSGPDSENTPYAVSMAVGFGYDSKTKDYKVVRVVRYFGEPEHYTLVLLPRAEVFSLHAADSSWREISYSVGARMTFNHDMENYLDGVCYWYGRDFDSHETVVVSFDMADEVFQQTSTPGGYPELEYNRILGTINNESIALFFIPSWGLELRCIDVWLIKEFGAKECWTKQLTFGPVLGLIMPVMLWKNDEELLYRDEDYDLTSYDLATSKSKKLTSHLPTLARRWAARPYKKTLVSVTRSVAIPS